MLFFRDLNPLLKSMRGCITCLQYGNKSFVAFLPRIYSDFYLLEMNLNVVSLFWAVKLYGLATP